MSTKISSKGQVVIEKGIREKLQLKPGTLIEQKILDRSVVIIPLSTKQLWRRISKTQEKISKKWPKGLDSVALVREERK